MMVKLIVCDYDGTIFDTFKIVYDMLHSLDKEFNFSVFTSRKALKDIYMDNFYKSLRKSCSEADLSGFKKLLEKENKKKAGSLKLFKGMKKILKQLKKHYKLAIISSNFKSAMKKALKKNDIDFFDAILGAGKIESKVEKFKILEKRFKLKPNEVVYVCDTVGDIKEAKKAKVKTIGVTWGYHEKNRLSKAKPDKIISRPEQLIKAVENL